MTQADQAVVRHAVVVEAPTGPSTGASAAGPAFSPTSHRTVSCSAGTSARTGSSKPTPITPARSRSGSWPRHRSARGWSSSTATSNGTSRVGWLRDGVDGDAGWPLYLARYAALLTKAE